MPRPGMLPPTLNGSVVVCQVFPLSVDLMMEPGCSSQLFVYKPVASTPGSDRRVGCQCIHTIFVQIVPTNHICDRDPTVVYLVPTVCAADIGTRINKVLLCLVEHDAVDIAASGTRVNAVERVRHAWYGSMTCLRPGKPGTARNMTVNAIRVIFLSLFFHYSIPSF